MTKKQILKIVVMTLLIATLLCGMNFILCRQVNSRSDAIRVKNFYLLEENSMDMVMIGASTAYTNYSAPLAWNEYGFTSYSLATNMAPMGIAKSMLIEARKTQDPKLFVIDINGVLYNDEQESREGSLRLWIDNMPSSENKRNTIREFVPEDERMAYYIPFLKYHSNWPKLLTCIEDTIDELFSTDKVHLSALGMQGNTKVMKQKNIIDIKEHKEIVPMHKLSGQHLKELLEYCKSENLTNVVFTNMPRYYSEKMLPERGRNNAAKQLIAEYGYECIDLDDYVDEIGLDPKKDFYNPNHLNLYGQEKATKYLAGILNDRYQLSETKHEQKIIDRYNQEYAAYQKVYQFVDQKAKDGKDVRYNYDTVKKIIEK